ncbi:hypothetical protein PS15p_208310 [Mucor circinelloides]
MLKLSSVLPAQKEDATHNQVSPASVWKDWVAYANSNINEFHPFSLIANDIVRAGKGVLGKPDLDECLYTTHMQMKTTTPYPIPETFKEYIMAFTAAQDEAGRERVVNSMSMMLFEQKDVSFEFLRNILEEIRLTYLSQIDFNSSEDAYNQLFIWPHLISMTRSIAASNTQAKSEFLTGQPILHSMTKQMKAVGLYIDDKNVYKSDGVVLLFGLKQQEILLLETSGSFTNLDKTKTNFDNHKGVYGLLSMIKCIADDYRFGSVDTFMKIKAYFIHAADERLHLWSVGYRNEGAFDLWREASVHILPDESDKAVHIPRFVQFFWNTKCLVEDSISNIMALKQQHDANSIEHAFSLDEQQSLSDIVNPIILKLTKEDDHHGMATLGPIYSPSHQ